VRGGLTRTSTIRKNDVLVVPLAIQVFRYHLLFSNEIKRERWVDEEVNPPGLKKKPCKKMKL
jgi:hypothetical protein